MLIPEDTVSMQRRDPGVNSLRSCEGKVRNMLGVTVFPTHYANTLSNCVVVWYSVSVLISEAPRNPPGSTSKWWHNHNKTNHNAFCVYVMGLPHAPPPNILPKYVRPFCFRIFIHAEIWEACTLMFQGNMSGFRVRYKCSYSIRWISEFNHWIDYHLNS